MAGIPAVPRKSFLVVGQHGLDRAALTYRRDRAVPPGLVAKAERDGVTPELVELGLGDESWLIELRALESVVEALRESQEHYAGRTR